MCEKCGLSLVLLLAAVPPAPGAERERNLWPFRVDRFDAVGRRESRSGLGPLIFSQTLPDGGQARGFRPFWVAQADADGRHASTTFLYPLFVARTDGTLRIRSVLNLINQRAPAAGPVDENLPRGLDVWPFYFSRDTGAAATSYRAVFPIAGTVRNRFYRERVSWLLFPAYLRTEARGVVAQSWLWPFVRTASGGGVDRFALWPLVGWRSTAGVSRENYFLWPFAFRKTTGLDTPEPVESGGILPFFTYERRPGSDARTYAGPFFGYVHRTTPDRYDETRYFWPFLVQGRGDDRRVARWAPFHTRSVIKGYDKRWVLWPLYRHARWTDAGLDRAETRVLYFLYRSETQRHAGAAAGSGPVALKDHLWPLYSRWDNGAGRRQFEFFSPLGSIFPRNEHVRQAWVPLAALYRSDVQADGGTRRFFLFDLVTTRRSDGESEFHLGPLYGSLSSPAVRRIEFAGGLLRLQRAADGPWRVFWFDFSGPAGTSSAAR